jgi:sulfatase modifying factor 1
VTGVTPPKARPPRALLAANALALLLIQFEFGYLMGRNAGREEASAQRATAMQLAPGSALGAPASSAAPTPETSASSPPARTVVDTAGPLIDAARPLDPLAGEDSTEPAPQSSIDVESLLALVPMTTRDAASLAIARAIVGPRLVHANQGNPAISKHSVTRAQCLAGLSGVTLQTPAQRTVCGHDGEVPIYADGDMTHAKSCIDLFEYPNRACVRPFVYTYGKNEQQLCALDGKRLCTQDEWATACDADPTGGPPRMYSYGDELDLSACNTAKKWPPVGGPSCVPSGDVWGTCATLTEPAGSFPRCRSRLGVFDLEGNVAEGMLRVENKVKFIQFKGSAFFYDGKMYADTCRHDPRWHVDPIDQSWHTNYHLGFRCCRDVPAKP